MKKDLVILTADKDMEHALKGLFTRPEALDIRLIETDILVHPQHDPACARRGVALLSNLSERYRYGLLMFDHEGSGKEQDAIEEIEQSINEDFVRSAWGDRARAIVLSPELEAWIWSDSPHIDEVTGWKGRHPPLRHWLTDQGWLGENAVKPGRPKEAFQAALREARKPRSASLYRQIAERVSLRHCTDRSLLEFKGILRKWFPGD